MRFILIYLLLSFSVLSINAQFFDHDNTSGIYEDKINEFVYVYGLTAERNVFMNKYDANFNLLKEYVGNRSLGNRERCYFFMTGYIKKVMLVGGDPNASPYIYIDSELNDIDPVSSGENMIGFAARFNQGKLDYYVRFQNTDEALSKMSKKKKKKTHMGDMKIICNEVTSPNVVTKWIKYLPIKGIADMVIHNIDDSVMFFSTEVSSNSVNLYEYNIESEKIIRTKSIVNPSVAKSTYQNITYDSYRDRYYVSFVENIVGYSSKIRVYTLNSQLELEKEVIEVLNEFPVEDCKIGSYRGKWVFTILNNRPYINITKDLVNISVMHSLNVRIVAPAGTFYREMMIGLTDIIITDEKVETYFHNKQTILDQRNLYYDQEKKSPVDYTLDLNYYSKFYKSGVPYYILDKKIFDKALGQIVMKNGTEVLFVDMSDYRYPLTSKSIKFIVNDGHAGGPYEYTGQTRFIQSKDQSKLLALSLQNVDEGIPIYKIIIEDL